MVTKENYLEASRFKRIEVFMKLLQERDALLEQVEKMASKLHEYHDWGAHPDGQHLLHKKEECGACQALQSWQAFKEKMK